MSVSSVNYTCSSRSATDFQALCTQMRLHDVAKGASDLLSDNLYENQVRYRYGFDTRWVESKLSGNRDDARVALPLLVTQRTFRRCSMHPTTLAVKC